MKRSTMFRAGVALAAILLVQIGGTAGAQTPGAGDPVYSLQTVGAEVTRHPQTGLATWMSGSAGQPIALANARARGLSAEGAAAAFLNSQAVAFGLRSGSAELEPTRIADDGLGRVFVRFQQRYRNVPIIGADLNVQVDGERNVISANGKSVGDLNLSVQPSVSANDAVRTALDATSRVRKVPLVALTGSTQTLAIHDPRIMGGPAASPALVWRVDVTSQTRPDIHEIVLVDAQNGRVRVQFNQVANAAPPANAKQWVCDAANTATKFPCTLAQSVSNPASSAIADVKNAARFAENTYDFFARRFGRNSLDDKGLRLVSTVRFRDPANPSQDFANAFWSSERRQMVYGKDYASAKDVVGHELSHGFTNFTSNLFYYYQSGAINESLSDVFGTFIQQSIDGGNDWFMGEELPIGAIRNMADPTQFNDPDKMTSPLWTGDFSFLDQGGVHTNSGVGNKTAFLITDGGTFNGRTVAGIGLDKAAAIFYRVNAFLLQSASDYADLGNALQQACNDLIGTRPKNQAGQASASGKISAANCNNLKKAVAATELNKQPQFWPIPAEAPVCASNQNPVNKLFERFAANNSANFKFQPSDSHWFVIDTYAASNAKAVGAGGNGKFDTQLSQTTAVNIPANAFLRFAHYYNLFTDNSGSYAGGVVEYQVGNGAWKRVTPAMFLNNKYNVTLKNGTNNVLAGQKAFSGFSGGWTSSRVNLSSLAGKSVKFRFRLATDVNGAWDSWIIDDIQIYTCQAAAPAVASAN